jgi:hypothetical protein
MTDVRPWTDWSFYAIYRVMKRGERVPLLDKAKAHAGAALSRLCVAVPVFGDFIIGGDERVQPVYYDVVDDVRGKAGSWASYPGDPKGTPWLIPRLYRQVAWTEVNREEILRFREGDQSGLRLAIAWKVGEATVAAALTDEQVEQVYMDEGYGMRVGRGPLTTTLGVVSRADNLYVAQEAVTPGEVMWLHRENQPENEDMQVYPANRAIY